jgi:hypothetical protein
VVGKEGGIVVRHTHPGCKLLEGLKVTVGTTPDTEHASQSARRSSHGVSIDVEIGTST